MSYVPATLSVGPVGRMPLSEHTLYRSWGDSSPGHKKDTFHVIGTVLHNSYKHDYSFSNLSTGGAIRAILSSTNR